MKESWQQTVAAKIDARDALIQAHCTSTDAKKPGDITAIDDVGRLTQLLSSGSVTAENVVQAYIKHLSSTQRKICFNDAILQAKRLDDYQREHGKLLGPLHGVPISVKDQFNVVGYDTTLGYVGRAFQPARSNALVVDVLQGLGAIVIAKTNLPQSIMWCETESPLWGLTTHPMNKDFTPGGSSGGEAALLALHGSLIGWGTDLGGSIRIPSHMNGLWGFKPSNGRMSYRGVEVSQEGQQHVPSAVGPITRSLSTMTLVTKHVIEAKLWSLDSQLPPMPWKSVVFEDLASRPLVIGVMPDDGVVKPHPPIARVFRETVSRLRTAGHEIVEWDNSLNSECIAIMDEYYTADGGEDIRSAVLQGGEPFIPHVQALIDRGTPITVYEYWQLNKRKVAAQQAYLEMWDGIKSPSGRAVDVLLVPTMPHTAVPHRCCRWVGYTKLFNFLDYPALSFPAGKVDKEIDTELDQDYISRNDHDAWNQKQYNLETMHGHHIGLQIVARKFEEERVLGAAHQIEALMRIDGV
ncbi:acetamidase [Aureobasidium sp. EXF-10727]|nr:acetamidase [Aureobasidium sp. EXF-10727]